MHPCPACKVPLHGHEESCPSCGARQTVRAEYRGSKLPPPPGVNPVPIVIAVVILIGVGIMALQSSWVGELLTKGVPKPDPLTVMAPIDARNHLESGLQQNLSAAGAPCKITYTSGGQPATKMTNGILEMNVETKLANPNARRQIIDPVTQFMGPGKVSTLVVKDEKSHHEWTYNATMPDTTQNAQPSPFDDTASDTATATSSQQPQQQQQQAQQQQAQQQQQQQQQTQQQLQEQQKQEQQDKDLGF